MPERVDQLKFVLEAMPAIRMIATMVVDPARGVIKGRQFQHDRVIGEPIQWSQVMSEIREIDELVVFNINNRAADIAFVERLAAEISIPMAYGGGIYDLNTATSIAKIADKIVLTRTGLMAVLAEHIGSQSVVGCVDTTNPLFAARLAGDMVASGAGEIIVQNPEHDGTLRGYDLDLLRSVRDAVDVPVIASAGAGAIEDFVAAAQLGIDGLAAGAIWQFTDITPREVKIALAAAGYPVRPG